MEISGGSDWFEDSLDMMTSGAFDPTETDMSYLDDFCSKYGSYK